MSLPLETLWAELLSREPERIAEAWRSLNREEQAAVTAHLIRMTTEDGWVEAQRVSANAALETIHKQQ